jgi:tripartite-type tricarboxylate transporter receptor subunit TctC
MAWLVRPASRARLSSGSTRICASLSSEAFKKRLVDAADDPAPSTPEEYAANVKRKGGKWAALIKKLGLKVE